MFTLQMTVSDGVNLSAVQTVTIQLVDVNERPTLSASVLSLTENSPVGTFVGRLSASDPDAGDQLSYSITGGNSGGAFSIDPATGVITVADSTAVDFETNPVFTLTAQVTDRGGLSHQQTITVNLVDQNESPVIAAGTYHIAEWSALGTSVGFVTASDVDAGDSLTFQIAGGNTGGRFLIDANTGEIRLADPANFTHEAQTSYTLTVQVQDLGGLTSAAQMIILVDNINTPPTAVDDVYTLAQLQAFTTSVANGILVNDSDPDSPTVTITLIGGPVHGTLTLNPDGTFSYLAAGTFFGTDSFTYQLSDGLETSRIATVTLNIAMVAPGGNSNGSDTETKPSDEPHVVDDTNHPIPRIVRYLPSGPPTVTFTSTTRNLWSDHDWSGPVTPPPSSDSTNLMTSLISSPGNPHEHWVRKHSRVVRLVTASVLPEIAKLTELPTDLLPDLSASILENGFMWNQLNHFRDGLHQNQQSAALVENLVVGTTTAVGGGLTVGYVIWLIRGGSLLAAMMSVMPSWMSFDPLPVMDQFEDEHREDDPESLVSIVSGKR